MPSEDEGDVAMLPVAADHAYEHKDGAPIVQLMASVFSELRLTEVSGGVEPSAAAGFFSRKGLERIGQLRKVRANGRLGAHLASLAQQLLKRAPLDSEAAQALVEARILLSNLRLLPIAPRLALLNLYLQVLLVPLRCKGALILRTIRVQYHLR